jgi:flagellar basal-body rod modification protein FlgD
MPVSSIGAESVVGQTQGDQFVSGDDDPLGSLKLDDFLKLLIAELKNQDPLEPLKNADILQQVSQIRQIGVSSRLNDTLDSVLLGQNVASAAALINQPIVGLSDSGENVFGYVDSVSIAGGQAKLHVGDQVVSIDKVREILPPE